MQLWRLTARVNAREREGEKDIVCMKFPVGLFHFFLGFALSFLQLLLLPSLCSQLLAFIGWADPATFAGVVLDSWYLMLTGSFFPCFPKVIA